jgi:hypothetical protein
MDYCCDSSKQETLINDYEYIQKINTTSRMAIARNHFIGRLDWAYIVCAY